MNKLIIVFFVVLFLVGFVGCIFLFRYLCRYRDAQFDKKLEYIRAKYHTYNETLIYQRKVNLISVFGSYITLWFSFIIAYCNINKIWSASTNWIIGFLFFFLGGVFAGFLCIPAVKTTVIISNKPYIVLFHWYRQKETLIPYDEIKYYKYKRSFLCLKTEKKTYLFDYQDVDLDCLIKMLKNHRIKKKISWLYKYFNS